jgi:hypothetical protein
MRLLNHIRRFKVANGNGHNPYGVVQALSDTLVMAANQSKYKNGAFSGLINHDTPVLEALNMLIDSPLTTTHEKNVFRRNRTMYVKLQARVAARKQLSHLDLLRAMNQAGTTPFEMSDVFDADSRTRGEYVAPLLFQTLNSDGSVAVSKEILEDGTVKTTQGGVKGVPPSAPDSFGGSGFGIKINHGTSEACGQKDEDLSGNSQTGGEENGQGQNADNGKDKCTKAPKEDDKDGDFGFVFRKNLRGVFS